MPVTTAIRIKKMSPQFLTTNLERTIDYYVKQLGFELEFTYDDFYASVGREGQSIHLKAGQPFQEERDRKRRHEDLDVLFTVDGIDELYQEVTNHAANIIVSLREMPYGKEFYVTDPDGYVIAFLEETQN